MTQYNKRGRPAGSSRLNAEDGRHLRRVAECMILYPSLRLTPALREIGIDDETAQRRLRRKWKPIAAEYLAEAKSREADLRYQQFMGGVRQVGDFLLQVARVIDRAVTVGVERYATWAEANPREAENLKRLMLGVRTAQIEAKAHRG